MRKKSTAFGLFSVLFLIGSSIAFPCKAQTNVPGSIDITFNPGGTGFVMDSSIGGPTIVRCIAFQSDGKMIVGGRFTSYDGVPVPGIVRLTADGNIDPTFTPQQFSLGSASVSPTINTVVFQTVDGEEKILIGGFFNSYTTTGVTPTTTDVGGIARLNEDGTLDTNFVHGPGTGFTINPDPDVPPDFHVNAIIVQPDQSILVAGSFVSYVDTATHGTNCIARLSPNGVFDDTFVVDTSGAGTAGFTVNGTTATGALTLALQPDNKVLVGGLFNNFSRNGSAAIPPDLSTVNKIARLNSDGSLDTTFVNGIGTGFDVYRPSMPVSMIFDLLVQSNGDILAVGNFIDFTNAPSATDPTPTAITVNNLARLNSNGVLDQAFNSGPNSGFAPQNLSDFFYAANALLPGLNNSIIVGGGFTSYKGTEINKLAVINADGSLDTTFGVKLPNGFNDPIFTLAEQPNRGILVGGFFNKFTTPTGDVIAGSIARVFGQITPTPTPSPTATPTPSPTPTPAPGVQSTVGVVAQGKHFVITRTGGDLSAELVVFYRIRAKELGIFPANHVSYDAQARFKPGQTTKKIHLKKLKEFEALRINEGLKVVLRILPSPTSSTAAQKAMNHKAYIINPAEVRAVLILPPVIIPGPSTCSPFIFIN